MVAESRVQRGVVNRSIAMLSDACPVGMPKGSSIATVTGAVKGMRENTVASVPVVLARIGPINIRGRASISSRGRVCRLPKVLLARREANDAISPA